MDKRTDPTQQLKIRDSKIFNQKAETISKELKEMTGTPAIDPLSRKMAEIMTQRELSELGIEPTEFQPKKPTFSLPTTASPKANQQNFDLKPQKMRQESEPEPLPHTKFSAKNSKDRIPSLEKQDIERSQSLSKKKSEEKKDEMTNNIENIQAFQRELQNEYPELGLKDDEEGSSFHTNELNELEEACKTLNQDPSKVSPNLDRVDSGKLIDTSPTSEGKVKDLHPDFSKGKNPRKSLEKLVKPRPLSFIELDPQRSSLNEKKNFETFDFCSALYKGKTEATTVTCRTPDIARRQSFKQLDSANRAAFLHLTSKPVARYTPRCHINLANCKSSPIFFSFRAPAGSIMKSENGCASVDSLRVLLLKNLMEEKTEQDFFSKNLDWVSGIEKKLEKMREEKKNKEIEGCTFDPYFDRHEKERIRDEPLVYKALLRADLVTDREEFVPVIPEGIMKYEKLSPVDMKVRYNQGFNLEKIMETGRVLVTYQKINQFN